MRDHMASESQRRDVQFINSVSLESDYNEHPEFHKTLLYPYTRTPFMLQLMWESIFNCNRKQTLTKTKCVFLLVPAKAHCHHCGHQYWQRGQSDCGAPDAPIFLHHHLENRAALASCIANHSRGRIYMFSITAWKNGDGDKFICGSPRNRP